MFEELAEQVKESNVFYERNSLAVRRFFLCCARVIDAEFNVLFNDSFLQPIVFCCGGLAKNKTLLVMNVIATVCITLKSMKPSSGGSKS